MFGNGPKSSGGNGGPLSPAGNNIFPQLDQRAITDMVSQNSVGIRYNKAIKCPCTTGPTGQPNVNCPSCRGLGWAYTDIEQDPKFQRAMVHSRRANRLNDRGGWLTQGYASMTFLPGVIPGDGDLVQVCKDREVINDEYHVAGHTLMDGSTGETLRFRDVVCVERVIVQNKATQLIETVPENQWEFDKQQRRIVFHNPLPDGSQYSVRYIAIPEYILKAETSKPYLRVAHDDNLPLPAQIRKDIVYPFNVQAVRLDRAILQRLQGQKAIDEKSTFNNDEGRGPFT